MAKNKQLRARVEDDLFNRVQLKTDKMSDFVREAVLEKLEREEYGNDSNVSMEIKQLELIIESKQTAITQYKDIITREENEIAELQAQIDDKNRILYQREQREERIRNNPKIKEAFDETAIFLLRKKYLMLDGNPETIYNNKARELEYTKVNDFKEDLKKHIQKEWRNGRKFVIDETERELIQQDIDYMINRL